MIYGSAYFLEPIYPGIIPYIMTELLVEFNTLSIKQKLSMVIELGKSWDALFEEADNKEKALMHYQTAYKGELVDKIRLRNAIYVMEDGGIVFSEDIPNGKIVMAVQVRKYKGDEDAT